VKVRVSWDTVQAQSTRSVLGITAQAVTQFAAQFQHKGALPGTDLRLLLCRPRARYDVRQRQVVGDVDAQNERVVPESGKVGAWTRNGEGTGRGGTRPGGVSGRVCDIEVCEQ